MRLCFSLAPCLALAACAGGSDAPPPPANSAPQITLAPDIELIENDVNGVRITASDRDGDPLTYAIVGGADAAAFELFEDTLLAAAVLDFERPIDADGDNVFEVVVEVSDGQATARRALRIRVTNSREGFVLRRIRSGLGTLAAATTVQSNRFWTVATDGVVREEDFNTDTNRILGRVAGFDGSADRAILSVGSRVAADGAIHTLILARYGAELRVTEYRPEEIESAGPGTVRFSQGFASAALAKGNLFAEEGQLVLALGDNGEDVAAQDPDSPYGKVFRLVPDAGGGLSAQRIAFGVRDPALGFMTDGGLRVIDRGVLQDEINEQVPGNNFEWPSRDGEADGPVDFVAALPGTLAPPTFVWPANDSGTFVDYVEGTRYCTLDDLSMIVASRDGRFFSGNSIVGRFEERTQDFVTDAGTIDAPVALELYNDIYWGLTRAAVFDRDGEIYLIEQDIPCDKI